jgi:hypothetical protein
MLLCALAMRLAHERSSAMATGKGKSGKKASVPTNVISYVLVPAPKGSRAYAIVDRLLNGVVTTRAMVVGNDRTNVFSLVYYQAAGNGHFKGAEVHELRNEDEADDVITALFKKVWPKAIFS